MKFVFYLVLFLSTLSTQKSQAVKWGNPFKKTSPSTVDIPDVGLLGPEFHDGKSLSPHGVRFALCRLEKHGSFDVPCDTLKTCYNFEPSSEKGSQTRSSFIVSENTECARNLDRYNWETRFFVKELVKGAKELGNLDQVRGAFRIYALDNPEHPEDFPQLALNATSFSYQNQKKGQLRYFSVLPIAPGRSLFNQLKNFSAAYKMHQADKTLDRGSYKSDLYEIQTLMSALGYQLGRLHATHMTRGPNGRLTGKSHAVHGDFHSNNVWVSMEPGNINIIFIDVETMALSIKAPRMVGKDLLRLYLFSTLRTAPHQGMRKGNVGQTYWHEHVIKPFLLSYALAYAYLDGSYNQENFEDVMRILRKMFSLSGSTSDPEAFFLKAGPFKALWAYRKYIRALLGDIEHSVKSSLEGGREPSELGLYHTVKPKRMGRGRDYAHPMGAPRALPRDAPAY